MAQSYIVKPNDNLTKIATAYGLNWRDIWQANPAIKDPNLIYAGKTLVIPDAPGIKQPASSLEKTLPSSTTNPTTDTAGGKTLSDATAGAPPADKSLPASSIDQMTLLKLMLGEASSLATRQGVRGGLQTTFNTLESQGIRPENTSGSMSSRIIDFVEGRISKPIEREFDKMSTIIDSIGAQKKALQDQENKLKDDARARISQAITGGMWNKMTDDQRKELWEASGYTGEPVASKDTDVSASDIKAENYDDAKQEASRLFNVFIESRKADAAKTGTYYDGKIDPAVYTEARNKVPATYRDDFDKTFRSYLSDEAKKQFPVTGEAPTPSMDETMNQIKQAFLNYKNAGYKRKEVENVWKSENKADSIPSPIKKLLDEIY
jgi:hypothetical protein